MTPWALGRIRRAVGAWGLLVSAGEVADEDLSEINPAVDAAGLQAVEPRPGSALKHERDVLHGNALVAVCYTDGRGVVDQPVLRLHGAGLFWVRLTRG